MPVQRKIGPYRLVETLDTPGTGTVFKVYDDRLGRWAAMKVVRHGRPEEMERLRREALAIAALDHPNLARLYGVEQWEEGYGLVTELVEGVTLADRLEGGPPEVEAAVRLLSEITEGLAAIHEQGLLHRNLNAKNVLITPDGHVKITDFEWAEVTEPVDSEDRISWSGLRTGTLSTMSPEAIMGDSTDARSDLFSLGALAYEVLTGARPFDSGNAIRTLKSIVADRQVAVRERRPEVPKELSNLVDRLLEKNPADRPAQARDVLATLKRLPADESRSATIEAPAGLGWTVLVRWLRRARYRVFPKAAYRRHAVLVDRSFRKPLSADDGRELAALEEYLDRLEEPRLQAYRDDLVHLRDELKARKAGD